MPNDTPRIDNWSLLGYRVAEFYSPESEVLWQVIGCVYNYPGHPDGKNLKTSELTSTSGNQITTGTGSIYMLGTIDPDFRKFLEERELYDPSRPLACLGLEEGHPELRAFPHQISHQPSPSKVSWWQRLYRWIWAGSNS